MLFRLSIACLIMAGLIPFFVNANDHQTMKAAVDANLQALKDRDCDGVAEQAADDIASGECLIYRLGIHNRSHQKVHDLVLYLDVPQWTRWFQQLASSEQAVVYFRKTGKVINGVNVSFDYLHPRQKVTYIYMVKVE